MQHHPHVARFVEAELDEVVAGAQRAEVAEAPRVRRLRGAARRRRRSRPSRSPTPRSPADRAARPAQAPLSLRPPLSVRPCGTAASMAERMPARSSGRCSARMEVLTAIMPQPMSTPTAAGMMAPDGRDHRAHGRAHAPVHVGHDVRRCLKLCTPTLSEDSLTDRWSETPYSPLWRPSSPAQQPNGGARRSR